MQIVLDSPAIKVMQSAFYQTNTAMIVLPGLTLLTDPGWIPHEVAFIQKQLHDHNQPLFLAFTHADYDHLAGSGAYSNCRNIMSTTMAEKTQREKVIQKIADLDQQFYFVRPYKVTFPYPDIVIYSPEQHFSINNNEFIALLIPGHSAEDMALYNLDLGILVLGDYLSKLEFPFIEYNYASYYKSLDKLHQFISLYKPKLIVPGHGPYYEDYRETLHRISIDLSYLENLKVKSSPWEEWAGSYTFAESLLSAHQNNLKYMVPR